MDRYLCIVREKAVSAETYSRRHFSPPLARKRAKNRRFRMAPTIVYAARFTDVATCLNFFLAYVRVKHVRKSICAIPKRFLLSEPCHCAKFDTQRSFAGAALEKNTTTDLHLNFVRQRKGPMFVFSPITPIIAIIVQSTVPLTTLID